MRDKIIIVWNVNPQQGAPSANDPYSALTYLPPANGVGKVMFSVVSVSQSVILSTIPGSGIPVTFKLFQLGPHSARKTCSLWRTDCNQVKCLLVGNSLRKSKEMMGFMCTATFDPWMGNKEMQTWNTSKFGIENALCKSIREEWCCCLWTIF